MNERHDATLRTIPVNQLQNTAHSTQHSDRVTRKLSEHKAAIAVKPVELHVKVKLPRVCLPPVDDNVRAKVKAHTLCLILGGILAVLVTTIGPFWAIHVAPAVPTGPGLVMYLLDRIRNR